MESEPHIMRGTAAFRRTNLAMFAAGFATFALMYCVQPLLPVFAADFHVSPLVSSFALSLTTFTLAGALLIASALSEVWGRKPMMVASILGAAVLTMISAAIPHWGGSWSCAPRSGWSSPASRQLRWDIWRRKSTRNRSASPWDYMSAAAASAA
jgi:Major Facilitator Superfamily.